MKEVIKEVNGVEVIFGEKVLFINEQEYKFYYAYFTNDNEVIKHKVWKSEEYSEEKLVEFVEQYKNESIK
jgi:hypothetical protein